MPRSLSFFRLLCAGLLPLGLVGAAEPPPPVHAFLSAHCTDCHGGDQTKGNLDLIALKFDLGDPTAFARWVQVLDRADHGEMPPKTEERPRAAELRAFTFCLSLPPTSAVTPVTRSR